jgi:demethylmenaquinone methyltransferase/2-methoxy-6-polyprenyl-1,4-benzoquinol methylase
MNEIIMWNKGNSSGEMPDYYRRSYEKWYSWFAYIYDAFLRVLFFFLNGGLGGERRWRELIIRWIDPQAGEKILDICSGTGTLTIMLGRRLAGRAEVVGIELSPIQLRIAQRKQRPHGVSFVEGDAQDIPFSDCYFDKGVICGALHEMPQDVRQNVLSEAYRVIRPGGRMVIVEHNKPDRRWKAILFDLMEHLNPEYPTYRNMLECGLVDEIERSGFRVVRTSAISWEYFQIVLAERLIHNVQGMGRHA